MAGQFGLTSTGGCDDTEVIRGDGCGVKRPRRFSCHVGLGRLVERKAYQAGPKRMSKIYVSYSRRSKDIVVILVEAIEALDYTIWFDQDLKGGQLWWDRILESIRNCDIFIFVLDSHSLGSTACKRELNYAAALGKPILPVLVADGVSTGTLPQILSKIQYVDYRKRDHREASRLASAIFKLPPADALPHPLPTPPQAPIHPDLARWAEQIGMSTLNLQQQSSLVYELRQGLDDPEIGEDVQALLRKMRNRRDLIVGVAEEIGKLLETPAPKKPEGPKKFFGEKMQGQRIKIGKILGILGFGTAFTSYVSWVGDRDLGLSSPIEYIFVIGFSIMSGALGALSGILLGVCAAAVWQIVRLRSQ